MYDKRKEELKKIKNTKAQEVDTLQRQISILNQKLRIAADEHNRAAWILEEYEALEQKQGEESKLKLVNKDGKNE